MPRPKSAAKLVEPKRKVPKWVTDHFESSLAANETLLRLIHLSERGISLITGMPQVVKVLADVHGSLDTPKSKEDIKRAEREAALAQTEIETEFPVLHGLAVVALWSWLEHFIKGLIVVWLLNRKESLSAPAIQKLKMRLGDYVQLQKTEQAAYLVELLEQDTASSLKRGVNRFESILEPFSLSGAVPEDCSQAIFELQQVRNVIAHRNGRTDRRLKTECPWLKLRLNQPVHVSRKMLRRYSEASVHYLVAVLYRIGDVYGHNLRDTKEKELPNTAVQGTLRDKAAKRPRP